MKIGISCRIYQDPLCHTLGLSIYEIFITCTCLLLYHNPCTQICARSYVRLINEGRCLLCDKSNRRLLTGRNQHFYTCVCVCVSHRAPLTQAAQQQRCVRGHNAVLHVLPCVLQSCKQEATLYYLSFISLSYKRPPASHTNRAPLLRSSSSSSSSFSFLLPSSLPESLLLSLATHWISPPVSCHSPL